MRNINELIESCKGNLIGNLCAEMQAYCSVAYPEFKLGTALGILSGASQRSVMCPGGFTVTYGLLIGPAGCGKNDYLEVARTYLHRIDPRLSAADQSSAKVTKRTLSEFPSRIWVADEIGSIIFQGANPRSRDPLVQKVLELWLTLWSPPSLLPGSKAMDKAREVPDVEHARWSMLGAMTNADYGNICEIPEFVTKGLYSRLTFWKVDQAVMPDFKPVRRSFVPSPDTLSSLQRIFRAGLIGGGNGMDPDGARDWLDEPKDALTFEAEALERFSARWRGANVDVAKARAEDREVVSGVVGRGKSKALTFSCLHAVARGSASLEMEDVMWGWDLAEILTTRDLKGLHIESVEQRMRDEIMRQLHQVGGRPQTVAQLQKASRKLKGDHGVVVAACLTLERDGLVFCTDSRRGRFAVELAPPGATDAPPLGSRDVPRPTATN